MSDPLTLIADRAVGWSVTADRLKARQDGMRSAVLFLSIGGALTAAIASQIPTDRGAEIEQAHRLIAMAGAAGLAIASLVSSRFLGQDKTAAWTLSRATSEALKREAFRFAAHAAPYDDADPAAAGRVLADQRRKIEEAATGRSVSPADDPGRAGSAPRAYLTAGQYLTQRVAAQAQGFYRVKAVAYARTAANLKRVELGLSVAATLMTVYAGAYGKLVTSGAWSFDLAALTAVLTTVSAAILAHVQAARLDHLVDTYSATARRLEDQAEQFDDAQRDPAAWSAFVNKCEDVIAAENSSWVAKWAEKDG